MARTFPSFSNNLSFSSTSLFASIASLSIMALVISLCTSSRKAKKSNRFQQQRKFVAKVNSSISGKAISMAKMISWRKVDAGNEEEEEEKGGGYDLSDDEVWRKTIMKGERCRPLEFSGKIDYDSDGNLLCDSKREFKSVGS